MFPFKIGTTSYIYPDGYVRNVKMLAPYLDEIELLLLESKPDSLPSHRDIKELLYLANEYDLTYNIHLPIDISLGDPDPGARHSAMELLKQVMDLTAPLSPSTCTLHLPYDENGIETEKINTWKDRLYNCIRQLIRPGINGELISIETLTYPLDWVEDILIDFNLSVCMDIGHLMVNRADIGSVFSRYERRTSILHLHGVEDHKDHLSLDRLSEEKSSLIMKILRSFQKTVSLEIFSYDHLKDSLEYLEKRWYDASCP